MGKIIYNGIDCGGGGSGTSIEPNPSETATDTLEKLGIDGTVYDFEGTTYTAGTNIQIVNDVISATDTTYSAFQGTDGTEAGSSGLVPAPAASDTNKYLKSDGTWATVSGGGGSGNVDDVYVNGTSVLDSNNIAQIISYKELTQAEYDALPDSKLTDDVLYCIKDVGINEGEKFAPIIYSFEEREVGVWTDGKPLYQKTFNLQLSGNQGTVDISSLNVETGWIYDGYYDIGVTNLSHNEWLSANQYTRTHLNDALSPPYIDLYCKGWNNVPASITIRYTKTTDVAGSGNWGMNGIPAVHYSENEQVIGTWIDGKPLYQKSYKNLDIGTTNIHALVLSDLQNIESIRIVTEGSQISDAIPFPYIHYTATNIIGYFTEINNGVPTIQIRKGTDSRSLSNLAYLTVQYTKTTD